MNSINLNVKQSKRKIIIVSIISLMVLTISICIYRIIQSINYWNNLIYPCIYIKNIDVGGMKRNEALQVINLSYIDKIKNKEINLNYDNLHYFLRLSKLGVKTNIENVLDEAMSYGKDASIINKFKILFKKQRVDFDFKVEMDDSSLNNELNNLLKKIYKDPINAKLNIDQGKFILTKEEDGIAVDNAELGNRIKACINNYNDENISIYIPVKVVKAKIKYDMLKEINGALSSFTTNLRNSQEGRVKNIEKGVAAINGTIILPGETFSFNDVVGDTSRDRGYFPAPEILHGKLEQGYGGGICQVSSTLYGAILRSNIQPTMRQHHSFPVNYVPEGLDATIVYGLIDFKFKNIYDCPIYIKGSVKNKNVTFSVYSDVSFLKGRTYDFYSTNKKIIPAKSIYVDDPNLNEGIFETRVKPRDGVICDIYRITYDKNGNILEDKFVYKDTYSSINEIVAVGIKKR